MSDHIEIILSNGQAALIDKEDAELVSQYNWSMNGKGYVRTNVKVGPRKYREVSLHRLVMGVLDKPEILVDHEGGNKLDNRKGKLRRCTKAQNGWNQCPQSTNSSGYKGVTEKSGKWLAQIRANGQRHYLGSFDTPDEAAHAFNKAAICLHGDFAVLNPIGASEEARIASRRKITRAKQIRSEHPGVHWDKHHNRWRASITKGRKRTMLGNFQTKEEAIAARAAAENENA